MPSIISATTTNGLSTSADNSGSLQLQTNNGTTAVTIDTSQNVGIGTASPASFGKLAVTGVSNFGVDQTDYIGIQGGGGTARIDAFGSNTNINTSLSTKGTGSFYIWRGGYGGTNTLLIDGSSNLQFNSGYGSVAVAYGCRAWVNFNGTGTVAIRASGNVTSITDNGTGDYTVNFTTAMPDTNSSVVGSSRYSSAGAGVYTETYQNAVGTAKVFTRGDNSTTYDAEFINVSVFR